MLVKAKYIIDVLDVQMFILKDTIYDTRMCQVIQHRLSLIIHYL